MEREHPANPDGPPDFPPPRDDHPYEWTDCRTGKRHGPDDPETHRLMLLRGMSPAQYEREDEWKDFVTLYHRVRAPVVCRACGTSESIDLHHPDYRVVGQEMLYGDDVIPLCREHHTWTELLIQAGPKRKTAHHTIIAAYREIHAAGMRVQITPDAPEPRTWLPLDEYVAQQRAEARAESLRGRCRTCGDPIPCRFGHGQA